MLIYARLYFHNEIARAERYLQISRAMIIGLDCNGNVNLINRRGCEILGYNEKEILGKNWFETVVPDHDREEVYKHFREIIAGEAELLESYENTVLTKDGATRYIDWNNDVELNKKGVIIGTLSSGQDVTDRKRAEEKAQRQQRDMAHELNQPLTALVSYCGTAEVLVQSLPEPPQKINEILSLATEQAHRAADIIRRLREFVSKTDKNIEVVDIDLVIKEVIALLKRDVQSNGSNSRGRVHTPRCTRRLKPALLQGN